MRVRVVTQPFKADDGSGDALAAALATGGYARLDVVVAWAKVSGLSRVEVALKAFRGNGGKASLLVGVDAHGSTKADLLRALPMFDEAWFYYDPGERTFHPKLYLASNEDGAWALVGSSNLTAGGLFTNYELGVELKLTLALPDDEVAYRELVNYRERLLATPAACRVLDEEGIAWLEEKGLLPPPDNGDGASDKARRPTKTIGPAVPGLRSAPPAPKPPAPVGQPPPATVPGPAPKAPSPTASPVQPGFWKLLSANDVSLSSSPGQMIVPIRFLPFFGELVEQPTTVSGAKQYERLFPVSYSDGNTVKTLKARVIHYVPGKDHARSNAEVRFTLHNRDILKTLEKGDVLVFTRGSDDVVGVRRQATPPVGAAGRWGWLGRSSP